MTEVAATNAAETQTDSDPIIFQGSPQNISVAIAMFATAALAFSMSLTDVYFAEATAWTFVIWGALLLFNNLLEVYQSYEVTAESLIVRNPVRFLQAAKVWNWENIQRLEVTVKRTDAEYKDAVMQIYYQEPGELTIEREDRIYDPELERLVIERAGLAADGSTLEDFTTLPQVKTTYIWK